MSEDINTEEGLLDLFYAISKYPTGFTRPHVAYGWFPNNNIGKAQKQFFQYLQSERFKRTLFQMIFPKQNAGLIRTYSDEGIELETHVRFYSDGVISCEIETGRWEYRGNHFHDDREDGLMYLEDLVSKSPFNKTTKDMISMQFGTRDYSKNCIISHDDPFYQKLSPIVDLSALLVAVCVPLYFWEYHIGPAILDSVIKLFTK